MLNLKSSVGTQKAEGADIAAIQLNKLVQTGLSSRPLPTVSSSRLSDTYEFCKSTKSELLAEKLLDRVTSEKTRIKNECALIQALITDSFAKDL
jgi:hypothetical protein